MKKRLASVLLCFFLCVTLFPAAAKATETAAVNVPEIPTEGDVWDGSITQPTTLVQKDGINYYEITKCAELAYVAQTGGNWLNANYILGNNLIFNDKTIEWDETGNLLTSPEDLNEWTPIGSVGDSYFSGSFYGNGYLISGIYVGSGTYIGLFSRSNDEGTIDGITLVNSYLAGKSRIGGIVGYNNGGLIRNCNNYSCVLSTSGIAGGICGASLYTDYYSNVIELCANYGDVLSEGSHVGGIVGESSRDDILMCTNYGNICADDNYIGGIVGFAETYPTILKNVNYGTVSGGSYVGGICGQAESETYLTQCISDCYNAGNVKGTDSVGGILGNSLSCKLTNCYNLSSVDGTSNIGAIVGYTDSLFGKSEEHYNYYLDGCAASGCGNTVDISDAVEKKSATQLKVRTSYYSWDFDAVWSISADKNEGYPYLRWQESTLSDIAVNDVEISETALALTVGDYAYLTATVSPANASDKSVTWKSSNSDIATVSAAGKVTAVSAGTATITATTEDGNYTATCTVTVTARISEEYIINSITIRDNDGATLSTIPIGTSLATVSITNLASEGNTLVYLAAYTSTGQYQGMMWVSVEDLPVDATIKVTLPVDNSDGKIANLKAFTVASFSNLTPLGEAVSFLP